MQSSGFESVNVWKQMHSCSRLCVGRVRNVVLSQAVSGSPLSSQWGTTLVTSKAYHTLATSMVQHWALALCCRRQAPNLVMARVREGGNKVEKMKHLKTYLHATWLVRMIQVCALAVHEIKSRAALLKVQIWPVCLGVTCLPPSGPAGGRTWSDPAGQWAASSPHPEFVWSEENKGWGQQMRAHKLRLCDFPFLSENILTPLSLPLLL